MKRNKVIPVILSLVVIITPLSTMRVEAFSLKDLNPANLFDNPFKKGQTKDVYNIEDLWKNDALVNEWDIPKEDDVYKSIVEEAVKAGKDDFSDDFYQDLASIIWNDETEDPVIKIIKIEKIWQENVSKEYPFYLEKWIKAYDQDENTSIKIIINEKDKNEQKDHKNESPLQTLPNTEDEEAIVEPVKEKNREIVIQKIKQDGNKFYKETTVQVVDSEGKTLEEKKSKEEISQTEADKIKNSKDNLISNHKNEQAPIEVKVDEKALEKKKEEVQIENQKTIFYTLNANDGYPQLADSGVLSLDHEKIAYTDIKDAIKIIAKKVGSRTFDDGKSMSFILNGKVLFIDKPNGEEVGSLEIKALEDKGPNPYKNTDGTYNIAFMTLEDVNDLLSDTNVLFKIQDTRDSATLNLVDYIERGGTFNLFVNNEEIKLQRAPIVENSKMLFSIREIATKLGATIDWNEKTREATIKNKETVMVFKEGDTSVLVNNVKEDLGVSIIIDGERMFAPVKYIIEQLGAQMTWDAKKFEVHIDKK